MIVRSGETDLWRFELRATPAERLIEAGYFGVNPVWRHVQNPSKKATGFELANSSLPHDLEQGVVGASRCHPGV
jgi:hypothetical protein